MPGKELYPLQLASLTTTQRDAIGSPAAGMSIWNTTVSRPQFYNGSKWCDYPYTWQYDAGHSAFSNPGAAACSMFGATQTWPTMAVGDSLIIRGACSLIANASGQTMSWFLKNGATTIAAATSSSVAAGATVHRWEIDLCVTCVAVGNSSTGTVVTSGHIAESAATSAVGDQLQASGTYLPFGHQSACATDGSGGALDVAIQPSVGTATTTVTPEGLTIVYQPKT